MEIRNIAIIAHVDHGKTTLTDGLLRQTGMVTDDSASMDSDILEQERGITIYSKNTSLFYKDTKINIVDTPGHADFGSEVERVLRCVDSVLLVVDAQEGPMPQTKFVLKKSLELGLKPIVIFNKIDKPAADVVWAYEAVLELFMGLGANDDQLDFISLYANGKAGVAKRYITDESDDLTPILDAVLDNVKPAEVKLDVPFRMQPFNLAYDNYLGRLAIGRVYEGTIKSNSKVVIKKPDGENRTGLITKIKTFQGMQKIDSDIAVAGDLVMVAGIPDIYIGETICENKDQKPLPAIIIDEPTISMNFMANGSPFAGRDGKFVTSRQIKERLEKELEVNVGLKIDFSAIDHFKVYGRGEMHLAVLLENMRREGFELQVSQPQVIVKEIDGIKSEPYEEITIDVPDSFVGIVVEKMGRRKSQMTNMVVKDGQTRLIFEIPSRGILGYRGQFIMDTKGEGIMCSQVIGFKKYAGPIEKRLFGSMISIATGKALSYALANLQERGALYIGPNVDVYEGMVIGNTSKGEDMNVNPIKGKHLTNMRASGSDDAINLTPPLQITLERGLETMTEDEYLELTPQHIRIRKQLLTENDRKKAMRR